ADPVHHELGERIALVGHAERGVARADQGPGRAHDHLQHVADGHLPGARQHRLAHLVQLVESFAHGSSDVSRARPAPHRAGVLGLLAQDGRVCRPMCAGAAVPSVVDMNDNRTALITGASRGLGRALAAGLAREGFDLIIDARDAVALDAAAGPLRAAAGPVTALPGDITDPAHRAELLAAAAAAGRLDLLVNNAG